MSSFNNKNILITGGASGIGFLMGKKALERGARRLIIWDINKKALDKAQKQLTDLGFTVAAMLTDVRNPEQVERASEEVFTQFGPVDILFNNAGIVVGKTFDNHSLEDIRRTMEVNSLGLMYVANVFLPEMIERASGHIINIASAAGLTPNPGMTVYAASKWAAVGWSESLKLELERLSSPVKILTVTTGYINTGMFEGASAPLLVPFLEPDNIADKILDAVEKNKTHLREPFMVKLTPFLKGILPAPVYDFLAGKIFKVYSSMDSFKGRT